jgi:outer membrane protein OmpA-like peptidoglycan-associated protein
MASDWDKTRPNIRIPRDEPEEEFGTTMLSGYRYQESEQPRQSTPQQTPPQQQKKNEGSGIPAWVWGLVIGFGGLVFLAIAGVILYLIIGGGSGFTLIVRGAPPNSTVYIDNDISRGTTTEKGEIIIHHLRAGRRTVRVTANGYADHNGTVDGKDGQTKYHDVTLTASGNGNRNGNRNGNGNGNGNKNGNNTDIEGEIERTGKVNLTINFKTGSAEILPVSFSPLDEVIAVLKKHIDWQIRVEGHTDNKGKAPYNQKLSEARAASVMKYFTDRGIAASRLTSKGFGLSSPIAGTVQNQTEEERTKNRRVTLVKTN